MSNQKATVEHAKQLKGVKLSSQGKVRNIYEFDGLIFETSNRLSVFDRIIQGDVKLKGNMLNCISQEFKKFLEKEYDVKTDYIPGSRKILKACGFKDNIGAVCYSKKLMMIPLEIVVRNYITGSAWKAYEKGDSYCGIKFPEGLQKNDRLSVPVVTPTTKETGGHDQPITKEEAINVVTNWLIESNFVPLEKTPEHLKAIYEFCTFFEIVEKFPEAENCNLEDVSDKWKALEFALVRKEATDFVNKIYDEALYIFEILADYCEDKGILLIDTKFEFGFDFSEITEFKNLHQYVRLADEVCTPDSSRFAPKDLYEQEGLIVSIDKQIVRDYCSSVGFTGELNQEIPEVPKRIWRQVTKNYVHIATTLFGKKVVEKYL